MQRLSNVFQSVGAHTMSWIDKELKRRSTKAVVQRKMEVPTESSEIAIKSLWRKLESANAALPQALQLQRSEGSATSNDSQSVSCSLTAPNGAALALSGTAIRYTWPKLNNKRSNNFWLGWDIQKSRYVISQRIDANSPPAIASYSFDEARIDVLIQRLVLAKLVKVRSLRKKRLWLF